MTPKVFRFCLMGWPPPGANAFEWKDSRLYFKYAPRVRWPVMLDGQSMKPTPEQWRLFWAFCDEAGVWTWPPTQGDLTIYDGLQYVLEFSVGGRSVASRGQASCGPPHVLETLHRIHRTLGSFIPNRLELDEECARKADQALAEHAREAEEARLAGLEHHRKCLAFWEHIREAGFTCLNCGGSVFRLSDGPGLSTCVICRACGRSFVGDASDELDPQDRPGPRPPSSAQTPGAGGSGV